MGLLLSTHFLYGATTPTPPDTLTAKHPPDTLWQFNANASRLGINTFQSAATLLSSFYNTKNTFRASINNQNLYNQGLPKGNRFVNRDLTIKQHYLQHHRAFSYGQQISFDDYAANQTRIGTLLATAQHHCPTHYGLIINSRLATGLALDERFNRQDYGPALQGRLQAQFKQGSGDTLLVAGAFGQGEYRSLGPRRKYNFGLGAGFTRFFGHNTFIDLSLQNKTHLMEDYVANQIQAVLSDTTTVGFGLGYGFAEKLWFKSDNQIGLPNRYFRFTQLENDMQPRQNSFFNQTQLNTRQQINYRNQKINAQLALLYNLRNRGYGVENNLGLPQPELAQIRQREQYKDIREAKTAWHTGLAWVPRNGHTIRLNTVAQLLRVDTQSDQNNQDRDELFYTGEVFYQKRWNQWFSTTTKVSGSYKHYVFIKAAQSIENFKERMLKFEPGFAFRPGRLSWRGSYGLWATYHVRDYPMAQTKNRSNRVYLITHNLRYQHRKGWQTDIDFLRRENRLGVINWHNFTESPLDTTTIYDIKIKLGKTIAFKNGARGGFSFGYRMFRQNREMLAGIQQPQGLQTIALNDIILQHGPLLGLRMYHTQSLRITTRFWFQISETYKTYDEAPGSFVGRSYTPHELAAHDTRFYPYFNVHVFWTPSNHRRNKTL